MKEKVTLSPECRRARAYLTMIAAGTGVFALAAILATLGAPLAFDNNLIVAMRDASDPSLPAGPAFLAKAARDVTTLGGTLFRTVLSVVFIGWFVLKRDAASAAALLAAILGELIFVDFLKDFFGRARPEIVPQLVEVSTRSFPSGHSASAAAIFLTIAALLAHRTEAPTVRRFAFIVAGILALLVGASRVYLGVHYPTDVIGGLGFGTAWSGLVLYATVRLQAREQKTRAENSAGFAD